jgi:hypothetical protein
MRVHQQKESTASQYAKLLSGAVSRGIDLDDEAAFLADAELCAAPTRGPRRTAFKLWREYQAATGQKTPPASEPAPEPTPTAYRELPSWDAVPTPIHPPEVCAAIAVLLRIPTLSPRVLERLRWGHLLRTSDSFVFIDDVEATVSPPLTNEQKRALAVLYHWAGVQQLLAPIVPVEPGSSTAAGHRELYAALRFVAEPHRSLTPAPAPMPSPSNTPPPEAHP